ncbi:MAG: DUF1501 domain-containing protein [Actinobacteria bacterium]|nr:DUF1501 domain-containing protein [Actinomycetota bacterium]
MPSDITACGCDDYAVSRRTFLRGFGGALGGTVVTSMVGGVATQVAFGAADSPGGTLVVLSLRGGADGLSIIVPHGDPAYAPARPTITVPTGSLLAPDEMFGLHPSLDPLLPWWNAGSFGAVHAVGLPLPNRSHFAAMEEVEDADAGSSERRGWINRMVGLVGEGDPVTGVQVGSPYVPTSLYGPSPVLGLTDLTRLQLPGANGGAAASIRRSLNHTWGAARGPLGRGAQSAIYTSNRMSGLSVAEVPTRTTAYPSTDLGRALRDTSRLIRSASGVRVVTLDFGGWDMHANVGRVTAGTMKSVLDDLAASLAAFMADLGPAADETTVVTISEFGRRVVENGDHGLDHGYGNCVLAIGAGIRGGQVHGRWPGLSEADTVDGDLRVTTDYRSVLWEILARRFPDASLPTIFPGFSPETVGIA